MILYLESEWHKLFSLYQVEPASSQKIFDEIVAAYSSNERHYHNLLHIQQVLKTANVLKPLALNFPTIQMAIWFHDFVYNPKAKDNEEKSAEYAVICLSNLNIPLSIINNVVNIILNTKNHYACPKDIDSQIMIDSDLSILGSNSLEYKAYARAIRQEYAWVSDTEYQIGRTKILQKFLQRERIYFTEIAFQQMETKARDNIKAEVYLS
jgi:predicted metal-dependent HD superfamily phosphohydrolase